MQTSNALLPAISVDGSLMTMTAGNASDYEISDINQSDHAPRVMMSVSNGVATLTGWVDDTSDKTSLEQATQSLNGIEQVKSYLKTINQDV